MNDNADVIIIGAGIAAIKASLELSKAGVSNIILEARDRIGGRLFTEKLKSGIPVDLGASWFHDCYDNPLLKKYWTNKKVDFVFDDGKSTFYNENGPIGANEHLMPIYEEIKVYLSELYNVLTPDQDISLKEAVYNYIQEKKYCLSEDQIRHIPQIVRFLEMWIGTSWEVLSGRSIAADEHKGRDAMVLNGYEAVVNSELGELLESVGATSMNELLERKNPVVSINLNNVVHKIEWIESVKKINVYTKFGDNIKRFTSDYIIFTAPLSILKLKDLSETGAIEWKPALPEKFTKSLERVSFSNLGKVFFEFPEIFWDMEDDRIFSAARVDENYYKSCLNDIEGVSSYKFEIKREDIPISDGQSVPNGLDYSILFLNLARAINKPVILALTSSPLTNYIESQTDTNKIFAVFRPVFSRMSGLKECEIPNPVEIKTSHWSADPFARGSYTGVTVGDDYDLMLEQLENPTEIFGGFNRVRFAGEGTIGDGNGCAHAAWNTGLREANNIIKDIQRSKF